MDNKRWTAVAGVLLISGIVTSTIFIQQRNEARQTLSEKRDQITNLEQRNIELSESLENQKSNLVAETDRAEIKKAALKATENQLTELKSLLSEKQVELYTVRSQLQQANDETARLKEQLESVQEKIADLASERNRWKEERNILVSRIEGMESEDAIRRTTITMLERKVEMRDERIIALDKKMQILNDTISVKDKQLTESQDSLWALQSEADGLKKDLAAANESTAGLEARLKELATEYDELITQARAQEIKIEAQRKAMNETYDALVAGLKQQLDSQEATIEEYREKLKLTFVDRILFGLSQVRISTEGKAALDKLAGVFANVPKGRISIVGHADNIPIADKFQYRFPSNWELSSARAAAVARYLLEHGNLEPSRIEVVGQSYYQPISDNDTETGRAKNRRVEIIIMPDR